MGYDGCVRQLRDPRSMGGRVGECGSSKLLVGHQRSSGDTRALSDRSVLSWIVAPRCHPPRSILANAPSTQHDSAGLGCVEYSRLVLLRTHLGHVTVRCHRDHVTGHSHQGHVTVHWSMC